MIFSSITFLFFFLPICLFCYYILPNKLRNIVLLFFSLIFYSWGEPIYIILMIFSSIVDYSIGLIIDRNRCNYKSKLALFSSIFINLSLLSLFKYSDFLIFNINHILNTNLKTLNFPLPIGISFYTFQTMSYAIDVYRNVVPVQRNFISFSTYVCLFPQLVAGPIVKYQDVANQLDYRIQTIENFSFGVYRFVNGLFKKVVIANNVGYIWSQIKVLSYSDISMLTAWLGIISFAFQIYYDFSGYSDMAIGLGKMFGFDFIENFNYPYISQSISEFWRRWHISLGEWFKNYVYIPLGGNRKGKLRWILNIFIVWCLTGFWHGASYNFIIWGLYFGFVLMLEKIFLFNILSKFPLVLRHIYVVITILISWVIFEFEDYTKILNYLSLMFLNKNLFIDKTFVYFLLPNLILYLIAILGSTPILNKIKYRLKILFVILGLILSVSFLIDSTFNPFLYFRF